MKIFVPAGGLYWRVQNEGYSDYRNNMIVIGFYPDDENPHDDVVFLDYKNEHTVCLGFDSTARFDSQYYSCLLKHADEIYDMIEDWEDVIVLADNNPQSLLPFKVLQNIDKEINLHLFALNPFAFEGKRIGKRYREMLSDLRDVKSFLLYDLGRSVEAVGQDETIMQLIDRNAWMLEEMFPGYVEQVLRLGDDNYFYDHDSGRFVETKMAFYGLEYIEKKDVLIVGNIKVRYRSGYLTDADDITRNFPPSDGHDICDILRAMRREFAEANGIEYEPQKCEYHGPCAGTCFACDNELKYLKKKLREMDGSAVFPNHIIDGFEQSPSYIEYDKLVTQGLILEDEGVSNKDEIPEFLKKEY